MQPDSLIVWAYSYLRFSDPKQEEGETVRRQIDARESWLARHPDVRFNKTLAFRDPGAMSGFTPKHRVDPRFVLAQIKVHVDKGNIRAGSYLIVENLDRLTREYWTESLPWCLDLIAKGVRIVQLFPTEVVYDSDMDMGRLVLMLMELSRAHEESRMKSIRVGDAWRKKKEAARQGVPHGRRCPAWLELVEGEYRIKPEAGTAIKKIYELSRRGYGSLRIKQELLALGVPPIAGKKWCRTYIVKILHDKSVIGEYQPQKRRGGCRENDGDPIPSYYPAVVSPSDFFANLVSQEARTLRTGRPRTKGRASYPFGGLIRSANDGSKLNVQVRHGRVMLISAAATDGDDGGCWTHFLADHFAAALLSQLREVSASQLFNDPGAAQVDELTGRLRDAEAKLAEAVARFNADRKSTTWANLIDKYDPEVRELKRQLQEATHAAQNPVSATWAEAVELMRKDDPGRLRQCLLETISEISALFVARGWEDKLCAVQVWFTGSNRRDYIIHSYSPRGRHTLHNRDTWVARSLAEKVPGEFDLRKKPHVAKLTRLLKAIDLSRF